jgi:hypothetical protein
MRNGIATLLIAGALLAGTAFASGIKAPARPNKAQVEVATPATAAEALVQQLEASLPRATTLAPPL